MPRQIEQARAPGQGGGIIREEEVKPRDAQDLKEDKRAQVDGITPVAEQWHPAAQRPEDGGKQQSEPGQGGRRQMTEGEGLTCGHGRGEPAPEEDADDEPPLVKPLKRSFCESS